MNATTGLLIRIYNGSLRLFPVRFQEEYGDEMSGVFADGIRDAAAVSTWSAGRLVLLELRDLPVNLVREHLAEWKLRLQQTPSGPGESFPRSILYGAWIFGFSFVFVYLAFCLLDVLLNSGKPIFDASSLWTGHWTYAQALACAISVAWMGARAGGRRAWFTGLVVALVLAAFSTVWIYGIASRSISQVSSLRLLVGMQSNITGLVVGSALAWSLYQWKKWGWLALAGVFGFNLGWLVVAFPGTAIVAQIQSIGLDRLVVGGIWYFGYWLVVTLPYGLVVGSCLGLAMGRNQGLGIRKLHAQ